MKKLLIVIMLGIASMHAQEVIINVVDTNLKINQPFLVEYVVNFKVDSLSSFKFENFRVHRQPAIDKYVSAISGRYTYEFKYNVQMNATQGGKIYLTSPIFYSDGKSYQDSILLNVATVKMPEQEIDSIYFVGYLNKTPPAGTQRIVAHQKYAYIEVYTGFGWQFKRRLTAKEQKKVNKLGLN